MNYAYISIYAISSFISLAMTHAPRSPLHGPRAAATVMGPERTNHKGFRDFKFVSHGVLSF